MWGGKGELELSISLAAVINDHQLYFNSFIIYAYFFQKPKRKLHSETYIPEGLAGHCSIPPINKTSNQWIN